MATRLLSHNFKNTRPAEPHGFSGGLPYQTLIRLATAVQGAEWAHALGIIDVRSYGAVGDGSTSNNTAFAAVAAVVNASTTPLTVYFPTGVYNYSSGLAFTKPVSLRGDVGATLNYSGSGKAISLGPDGLTVLAPHTTPYIVQGLRFTGGSSMTHGIYINSFIVYPRLRDLEFYNFGNTNAYAVFAQSDNWDLEMSSVSFVSNDSVTRNCVRVRGRSAADVSDNGNSRLRFLGGHLTNTTLSGGVGIWVTGTNSEIAHSKIEGFIPNIRVGASAAGTSLHENYYEARGNCIEFGDPAGGDAPSNFLAALRVQGGYANMHHPSNTGYFIAAAGTLCGLQEANIEGVRFANHDTREVVHVNVGVASQVRNAITRLTGIDSNTTITNGGTWATGPLLSNTPAYIQAWGGASGNIDLAPVAGGGKVHSKSGFVHARLTASPGAAILTREADEFVITQSSGSAFSVPAPQNETTGQRITIRIRNTSGGALGTVTWNAVFKMAAWTSPATGNSRSIDFQFDGTNWVEVSRTPGDVPN